MKYLWLIFPVITGAMMDHIGYDFFTWQYWIVAMCSVIPTTVAMEK